MLHIPAGRLGASLRSGSLGLALCLLLAGTARPASDGADASDSTRLRFHSEVVRLRVRADTLEVDGLYRFLCPSAAPDGAVLFYPYPADSLLGDARTLLVESRCSTGPWRPAPFREVERRGARGYAGARWQVAACTGDTLEVRTVYRQALRGAYARYIVTSTHAWAEPLEHAVFEIALPEGAKPLRFSYPFVRCESDHGVTYVYRASSFLPDRDIVVEWQPGTDRPTDRP